MNVRSFIVIMLLSFLVLPLTGQRKIKWMTWEQAIEKNKTEKRKFVVDIYTKWCNWCKKMDKSTFRNEFIVDYVNENFYPIKFDAQSTEDIFYNGKMYSFIKRGKKGYHELALEITKGQLSFPTVVFIDESFNVLQPIPGFQGSDRFEQIITYFAGDHFKTTPWNNYAKIYSRDSYAVPAGNKN